MTTSDLPRVIGITGAIGAGKTTFAQHLSSRHGYVVMPFAKPLKLMLQCCGVPWENLYGTQAEKETPLPLLCGKSARQALKWLGTEWGRLLVGQDLWVNIWADKAQQELAWGRNVVVDDCRFLNESRAVRRLGGVVVRIHRPDLKVAADGHASENGGATADYEINNFGTPAALDAAWKALLELMSAEREKADTSEEPVVGADA